MKRRSYSDNELTSRGLKPNGTVKRTFRYKASMIAKKVFNIGDIIEAIDKSASPYGRIPHKITEGKTYEVIGTRDCIVEIMNDNGDRVSYYANRFRRAS